MEEELKQLQKERKKLRDELIKAIELIKTCKNKDERKELFAYKEEIKMDIAEVEFEINELQSMQDSENDDEIIDDNREIIDDTIEEEEKPEEQILTNKNEENASN